MRNFWKQHGSGLMLLAGTMAVTLGAGMIYLPAGLITGGAFGIVWWVLDSIGGN